MYLFTPIFIHGRHLCINDLFPHSDLHEGHVNHNIALAASSLHVYFLLKSFHNRLSTTIGLRIDLFEPGLLLYFYGPLQSSVWEPNMNELMFY